MAATTTAKPATLAEALVAFHKEAPVILKDSLNPHFKSKFASLDALFAAARPVASKHGLVWLQFPTTLDGLPALRTILMHESGESLEDVMLLAIDRPGPQGQGAALTYARRYAVQAVLGLAADEDDDGNGAQKAAEKTSEPASPFQAPAPRSNGEQPDALEALSARLLAQGKLTQEQLDSAAKNMSPEEMLVRLERYANQVDAT